MNIRLLKKTTISGKDFPKGKELTVINELARELIASGNCEAMDQPTKEQNESKTKKRLEVMEGESLQDGNDSEHPSD